MTVPLRAALYLRVSTARQAEHHSSIPDQRRQGEGYCISRGYRLVETYVEPGASATNDRRPEFQRMIEAGISKPAPKKRLLTTIVLAATLAATGARADVSDHPLDAVNGGGAAEGDGDEAAIRRLLDQFRTIRIPLGQAIAIAEHLHAGSRTADVAK